MCISYNIRCKAETIRSITSCRRPSLRSFRKVFKATKNHTRPLLVIYLNSFPEMCKGNVTEKVEPFGLYFDESNDDEH